MGFFKIIPLTHSRQYAESQNNLFDLIKLKHPTLIFGCKKGCKSRNYLIYTLCCGEGGIRTPGTSQYVGFQDRCNRPLCHLSKSVYFVDEMWSLCLTSAKVMLILVIRKRNEENIFLLARKTAFFSVLRRVVLFLGCCFPKTWRFFSY